MKKVLITLLLSPAIVFAQDYEPTDLGGGGWGKLEWLGIFRMFSILVFITLGIIFLISLIIFLSPRKKADKRKKSRKFIIISLILSLVWLVIYWMANFFLTPFYGTPISH